MSSSMYKFTAMSISMHVFFFLFIIIIVYCEVGT